MEVNSQIASYRGILPSFLPAIFLALNSSANYGQSCLLKFFQLCEAVTNYMRSKRCVQGERAPNIQYELYNCSNSSKIGT